MAFKKWEISYAKCCLKWFASPSAKMAKKRPRNSINRKILVTHSIARSQSIFAGADQLAVVRKKMFLEQLRALERCFFLAVEAGQTKTARRHYYTQGWIDSCLFIIIIQGWIIAFGFCFISVPLGWALVRPLSFLFAEWMNGGNWWRGHCIDIVTSKCPFKFLLCPFNFLFLDWY